MPHDEVVQHPEGETPIHVPGAGCLAERLDRLEAKVDQTLTILRGTASDPDRGLHTRLTRLERFTAAHIRAYWAIGGVVGTAVLVAVMALVAREMVARQAQGGEPPKVSGVAR